MSEEQEVAEQNMEASESQHSEELVEALMPKTSEEEKARDKEHARQKVLEDRFNALKSPKMAAAQLGFSNAHLVFTQHILFNPDHEKASEMLAKIEKMDADIHKDQHNQMIRMHRKQEFLKIDQMLLEALAEQAEGDESKMLQYLEKRSAIKESLKLMK